MNFNYLLLFVLLQLQDCRCFGVTNIENYGKDKTFLAKICTFANGFQNQNVMTKADEALAQIEEKQYAKPFAQDSRKLYKIGVNFSTVTRRIEGWKIA